MASLLLAAPFVAAGAYSYRKHRKAKKQAAVMGGAKHPSASAKGGYLSKEDIRAFYTQALDEITEARAEMEASAQADGAVPVVLSHYIRNGRLQHWVIHAHGHKYELRQTTAGSNKGEREEEKETRRYRYNIAASEYDAEARRQSVLRHYSPEVGHYFYSVVGWTSLSRAQVDAACADVFAGFGAYDLLLNNCQDFLRAFADRVVTRRAPDWDWFRRHGVAAYRYSEGPRLDDDVVFAQVWAKQLRRERDGYHHRRQSAERREAQKLIDELETFIRNSLPAGRGPDGGDGHDGGHDGGGHDGGGGDGGC